MGACMGNGQRRALAAGLRTLYVFPHVEHAMRSPSRWPRIRKSGASSGNASVRTVVSDAHVLAAELERAREEAARVRQAAAGLQALSTALSHASTERDVADSVVQHGCPVLGACGIVIARLTTDGEFLEIMSVGDMPQGIRTDWTRFSS